MQLACLFFFSSGDTENFLPTARGEKLYGCCSHQNFKEEKKNKGVWKNTTCQKKFKNPIYHIIRALSLVPSYLAEFYSRKEPCLVIGFVTERPACRRVWIILWIMLMSERHTDMLTFRCSLPAVHSYVLLSCAFL